MNPALWQIFQPVRSPALSLKAQPHSPPWGKTNTKHVAGAELSIDARLKYGMVTWAGEIGSFKQTGKGKGNGGTLLKPRPPKGRGSPRTALSVRAISDIDRLSLQLGACESTEV